MKKNYNYFINIFILLVDKGFDFFFFLLQLHLKQLLWHG